jgi:hypothetical protein
MARVLGESARYVTKQSLKNYRRQFIAIVLVTFFLSLIIGVWLGLIFNKHAYLWILIPFVIILLLLFLTNKLIDRVIDNLEKKRMDFRKGATGEALVGFILEGFPDAYTVIHGLKPKLYYGDIDHVVVGPTGVYAIDTKNWKGIVTADGQGELLLNGRPSSKPEAKNLLDRSMFIKNKIKALTGLDPFTRAILAFPAARVEAKWGTTGAVHCMGDDQLYKYIVENKKGGTLSKKDIAVISQALLKPPGMRSVKRTRLWAIRRKEELS